MARYFTALYAHMSKIDVKVGQKLKYGDKLGNQGNTGYSFGEHTHGTVVKGWVTRSFSLDEAVPGGTFEPIRSEAELIFGYGDRTTLRQVLTVKMEPVSTTGTTHNIKSNMAQTTMLLT